MHCPLADAGRGQSARRRQRFLKQTEAPGRSRGQVLCASLRAWRGKGLRQLRRDAGACVHASSTASGRCVNYGTACCGWPEACCEASCSCVAPGSLLLGPQASRSLSARDGLSVSILLKHFIVLGIFMQQKCGLEKPACPLQACIQIPTHRVRATCIYVETLHA